ncbi:unnamed protein product [Ectocarpus sp. 12 AP-2014]
MFSASSSVRSDTTETTKTGSERKRRWAVCAAKMKAGVLRAKAFVTSSDSESCNGSSESEHEREGDSDKGSDSEVRDCGSRPSLKRSPSVSFPCTLDLAAQVQAREIPDSEAEPGVVCPRPCGDAVTILNGATSREGGRVIIVRDGPDQAARDDVEADTDAVAEADSGANIGGGGGGGGGADTPLRSPPDATVDALVDPLSLAGEAGEAGEGEGAREEEDSALWELSSSSEENNALSPTWPGSTSRPRVRRRDGGRENGHGHANSHPHAISSAQQVLPESPGSYVARMSRILAHVRQTTSPSASATNSPAPDSGRKAFGRPLGGSSSGSNEIAVGGESTVGGETVAPVEDCLEDSETVEQQQPGISAVDRTETSPAEGLGIEHRRLEGAVGMNQKPAAPDEKRWQGGRVLEGAELGEEHRGLVYNEEQPESRGDLELMIAAVSVMVGMTVPEQYQWILWIGCCAVTVWFPLRRHFRWLLWRGLDASAWQQPSREVLIDTGDGLDPPPPYDDIHADGVDVGGAGVLLTAGGPQAPSHENVDGRAGTPMFRGDSEKSMKAGEGVVESNGVLGGGEKPEEELEKRYQQLLAGLSKTELEFVESAGDEEKTRLLHQCLEYANYDMAGAIKVCSTFCKFRLQEGWDLVLSARELETPLRSRVHTLTTNRDRTGRGVLTFSPGKLDMDKAPPAAYHKMLCYVLQEVIKDEELQTKGLVLLVDARGVGFGLLRRFTLVDYKRGLRMLGGAFPAKVKAIRILHLNRVIRFALSIAMPLLSGKMRARVEFVTDERAGDGSFTKELADASSIPVELGIKGTWTGSRDFWDEWVGRRVAEHGSER